MKVLEVIHLRQMGHSNQSILDVLRATVKAECDGSEVTVLSRIGLASDLSIHIAREVHHPENLQSVTGQRLVAALNEYGLVEHTLWKEM